MVELEEEVVDKEVEEAPAEAAAPRISHNYQRDDLNDLRDAVNELFAR